MATSRLASNAARQAGRAQRAFLAQGVAAARSTASIGIDAARETARINSYTEPTNLLTGVDLGAGVAKIQIVNHKRVYPVQGDIDVPDVDLAAVADVTGLANATDYFVYYDDDTLALTAPVAHATTVQKDAQVGAAPGRHFLGKVTTPAGGGGSTSGGGGSRPPGGGGGDLP